MFEQGSILLTLWCSLVYYENESLMQREETFKVVFAKLFSLSLQSRERVAILCDINYRALANHAMWGKLLLSTAHQLNLTIYWDDIKAFFCTFTWRYVAKNNHIVKILQYYIILFAKTCIDPLGMETKQDLLKLS